MENKEKKTGKTIEIITGYRCNSGCIFCCADESFSSINMDTGKIKGLIARGKEKYKSKAIAFSGGEPTIRKDLLELVKFSKGLGFENIEIKSNGFMFHYGDKVKELAASGVDTFHITFHGTDGEVYEKITRVKNSLEYVMKGIENIMKEGRKVIIDHTVSRLNLDILKKSIIQLAEKGIGDFYLWLMLPEGKARAKGREICLSVSEVGEVYRGLFEYARKKNMFLKSLFIPYCIFPRYGDFIFNPREENIAMLTPQSEFSLESSSLEFGKKIKSCEKCREYGRCFGIHGGYMEVWGTEEFKPIKEIKT